MTVRLFTFFLSLFLFFLFSARKCVLFQVLSWEYLYLVDTFKEFQK